MSARRLRSRRRLPVNLDDDPFALLVNFFDCSIVFALGFMVAMLAQKSAGANTPERQPADGRSIAAPLKKTEDRKAGPGERLGVAYKLPSGDIVYVPDGSAPPR